MHQSLTSSGLLAGSLTSRSHTPVCPFDSERPHVIGQESYCPLAISTGQAFRIGRYPIHFHINGNMSLSYVRGCSIHHTFNRAVNIHNSHHVVVEHNVIYHVMGGAMFLEDSAETCTASSLLQLPYSVQMPMCHCYVFILQTTSCSTTSPCLSNRVRACSMMTSRQPLSGSPIQRITCVITMLLVAATSATGECSVGPNDYAV
mgnify:CR=1 FL=1